MIVLPESQLADPAVGGLHADVVVVKNVGTYSPQMITRYLQLYAQVGPHMSTVLNADDRASLEIAKSALVQKGKIYYFSKNSGLKDQIEEIGGVVSDGEEMKVFGVNRAKGGRLNMKLPQILPHDQEVALLAALAAVMDLGMEAENLAL